MAAHTMILRIHYQDTDATGVVFHGAYLGFAERGRVEALRAAGAPPIELARDGGMAFLVRSASLRYHRPLRLDDEVLMRTETIAIGGASCVIRQAFLHGDVLAAVARVELACVRIETGRPARIPPRFRAALAAITQPLPGEG